MENIEAMLCAYVEGELDEAGRAEIEKHLQQNPQHRKLIAELMRTRDLVRDLPRVSAPTEAGESLRRQVERLILLDDGDSDAVGPLAHQVRRWPTVLAVAAILLLSASLGLIVVKTLGPALKPAVVTQVTPKTTDAPARDESLRSSPTLNTGEPTASTSDRSNGALPEGFHGAADDRNRMGGFGGGGFMAGAGPAANGNLDNEKSGKIDLPAVRRVLLNSGYDLPQPAASNSAPVVLLVNTSDPALTNTVVSHFLNTSNNGIFWTMLPNQPWMDQSQHGDQNQNGANNAYKEQPGASLLQQAVQTPANNSNDSNNQYAQTQLQFAAPDTAHALMARQQVQSQSQTPAIADQPQALAPAPTTEPSGVMYLAKGMTRRQADELQRNLRDTGQETQFVETVAEAPATQPAAGTMADAAKAPATTQPQTPENVPANSDVAGAVAAAPSPAPAAVPIAPPPADNNGNAAPVVIDALIVVQPAGSQDAASTSRPAPQVTPASQPAN